MTQFKTVWFSIDGNNMMRDDFNRFLNDIKKYFKDPFFVGGIMLYEAEGRKSGSCGFSNSDYRVSIAFKKFLEKYLKLKNFNFTYRIYVHDTRKNDLERIKNFWAKKLIIKKNLIRISWKHNIVTKRRFNMNYVGQLEIRIVKCPYLSRKLLAASGIILKQYQKF